MKKTIALAAALIMAAAVMVPGCGSSEEHTLGMIVSDEKSATMEFDKAAEDDYVTGGPIAVEEGEVVEFTSELNEDGQVRISMYAVSEEQSMDELPDTDAASCEMMISGNAVQSCTVDPGKYDLKKDGKAWLRSRLFTC